MLNEHFSLCYQGASVILYRNADIRKHQIYAYAEWPGGLYGSPSMAGTRPGESISRELFTLKSQRVLRPITFRQRH
ncbi:hypothetical protein DPMN_071299 [Dreissena polymorpha]|uniref:Uncharacterized protein n=1 Tax=Dreissena polymorpha TaxID=45954 RepID=A0A9D3Z2P4_DREPO|nr:hypothetical protein DPMN_071299 [Dreissena polymorpha]